MEFWNWYMGFDLVERLLYTIAVLSSLCFGLALLLKLPKQNWFREYSEAFFTAVWLALVIRGSLVEVYSIPSESMVPTLLVEDHLLVSKFSFGWHLPMTKGRILEFKKPERGQIVIFVPPDRPQMTYVKRCVALPGDTVQVKNKILYVNGTPFDVPQAYAFMANMDPTVGAIIMPDYKEFIQEHGKDYQAKLADFQRRMRAGEHPEMDDENRVHDWLGPYKTVKGSYYLGLIPYDNPQLIARLDDLPAAGLAEIYPKNFAQHGIWNNLGNRDWFGPYQLKAGEYWMEGDDRDNSADSRFFGPVPEENLRGRPLLRYWPLNRFGLVQ